MSELFISDKVSTGDKIDFTLKNKKMFTGYISRLNAERMTVKGLRPIGKRDTNIPAKRNNTFLLEDVTYVQITEPAPF